MNLLTEKLDTSFHEAGHAIMAVHYGASFNKIKYVGSDTAGYLDGLTMPKSHTIRQYVSVGLGGWAAKEIFCGKPVDIMKHTDFLTDIRLIQIELSRTDYTLDRALFEIQPQTKEILKNNAHHLKNIAFALFEKGELTYNDCMSILL
jgi:ATP-dependent Zn protease